MSKLSLLTASGTAVPRLNICIARRSGFLSSSAPRRYVAVASLETAGIQDLLSRDMKVAELNEDAFAEPTEEELSPEAEKQEDVDGTASSSSRSSSSSSGAPSASGGSAPKRSREAIDAGMALFQKGDYQAAIEMFQLALELPGSGVVRRAGTVREIAVPSPGEENAALYNLACCWARLGAAPSALTCLEAVLENGFEDYAAIRSDPDLASIRGPELDRLLAKYESPFAKLFKRFG